MTADGKEEMSGTENEKFAHIKDLVKQGVYSDKLPESQQPNQPEDPMFKSIQTHFRKTAQATETPVGQSTNIQLEAIPAKVDISIATGSVTLKKESKELTEDQKQLLTRIEKLRELVASTIIKDKKAQFFPAGKHPQTRDLKLQPESYSLDNGSIHKMEAIPTDQDEETIDSFDMYKRVLKTPSGIAEIEYSPTNDGGSVQITLTQPHSPSSGQNIDQKIYEATIEKGSCEITDRESSSKTNDPGRIYLINSDARLENIPSEVVLKAENIVAFYVNDASQKPSLLNRLREFVLRKPT